MKITVCFGWVMMVYAFNYSTQEAEAKTSLVYKRVLGQSGLLTQRKPVSKHQPTKTKTKTKTKKSCVFFFSRTTNLEFLHFPEWFAKNSMHSHLPRREEKAIKTVLKNL